MLPSAVISCAPKSQSCRIDNERIRRVGCGLRLPCLMPSGCVGSMDKEWMWRLMNRRPDPPPMTASQALLKCDYIRRPTKFINGINAFKCTVIVMLWGNQMAVRFLTLQNLCVWWTNSCIITCPLWCSYYFYDHTIQSGEPDAIEFWGMSDVTSWLDVRKEISVSISNRLRLVHCLGG